MSGTVGISSTETARYTAFAHCLAGLELPEGWKIKMMLGPYVAYNQQQLADNFDGDHLLLLEDDHTFEPDLLLRLLAVDEDIVGAHYASRHGFWPARPSFDGQTGLVEVPAAGTGGLLVHRRVFEALERPYFDSRVLPGQWPDGQLGADEYFCAKAREAGFRIYLDTDTVMGHMTAAELLPVRNPDGDWQMHVTIGSQTIPVPLEASVEELVKEWVSDSAIARQRARVAAG